MRYKLLVIETNETLLEQWLPVFRLAFEVVTLTNALDAVEEAELFLPDVIIISDVLDEISGVAVCRQLKSHPRMFMVPIIITSFVCSDSIMLASLASGSLACLSKSLSAEVILAHLQTHVSTAHSLKYLESEIHKKGQELQQTRLEIIRKLGKASEFKDNDTGLHVERIARYAYCVANACGLSEEACVLLRQAAPMHDIGKIGIPDGILLKPGKLDTHEWEVMKRHAVLGASLIGDSDIDIFKAAKIVSLQHHEKWDGTGYPTGLSGKDIHIFARIVAVVDVFDALTTERPYKKPWSFDDAVKEVEKGSGRHFDPEVVTGFMRALPQIAAIGARYADGSADVLAVSLY